MPDERPEPRKTLPDAAPAPAKPPNPSWSAIKAKVTPGMLWPRPAPEPTDWTKLTRDEDGAQER